MKILATLFAHALTTKALTVALLIVASATTAWAQGPLEGAQAEYDELKRSAEQRYDEGSFTLAGRLYAQASELELDEARRRWVEFRLADTGWRAAAATRTADDTEAQRARVELERLIGTSDRVEEQDLVWAEAQASLGDFYWQRNNSRSMGQARPHYEAALGFWRRSSDLEVARARYLELVFGMALPSWDQSRRQHASYASQVPRKVLEGAVQVAESFADRGTARFLLGLHYLRSGRDFSLRGAVERELGSVLEMGKASEWYDDALFQLANYRQSTGAPERTESGWTWREDFVGAAELYRRLLREFQKGETSWYDQAASNLRHITATELWVHVDSFFLPGSAAGYRLGWRNAERVELTLHRTSLVRDPSPRADALGSWLDSIALERLEVAKRWTHDTEDSGEHRPGQAQLELDGDLPIGAYILHARAGTQSARALVLISDLSLTTKAAPGEILAWATDVNTGRPQAGAQLRLWESRWRDGRQRLRELHGESRADGTFLFRFPHDANYGQYLLTAGQGARQTYVLNGTHGRYGQGDDWRIYAHTDRPAYRPGDEVSWKVLARRMRDQVYRTPAEETLGWRIMNPRGEEVLTGSAVLDEFGSLSGSLPTDETMALGEYSVQFLNDKQGHIGQATLFRLEEYKLPEFEVSVATPKDDAGRPELYVVGDHVQVDVEASYYFGGPVAEAKVEVFVYQRPFWHRWREDREFPWFYGQDEGHHGWGGNGQQVLHEVLSTDLAGRATLSFPTPFDAGGDLEYTIEARVTDASRREITGQGQVRVTRSEFFVRLEAEHAIHRAGSEVELNVEALDANGSPVSTEGRIEVTRERWVQIFRDKSGRRRRAEGLPTGRGRENWTLHWSGYEKDVVAEGQLSTGADGRATWRFTPDRDGTYRARWNSVDGRENDITAETSVFVADEDTRELGYLPGGIEILVDQDTLEVGGEGVVVLAAPASDRWVLFSVEGEGLMHHEVLHLEGSVKLLRIPITEAHVPNVQLGAVSVHDGRAFQDLERLVVPPADSFLDVEVEHGAEDYVPGDEGQLTVVVRDRDGKPVSAQLSIAVVDEALSYIQGDYAGDPRQFFYGSLRNILVQTHGSFQHGRYLEVLEEELDDGDGRTGYRGPGDSAPPGGLKRQAAAEGFQMDQLEALGYAGEAKAMSAAPARSRASRDEMANNAPASPTGGGVEVRVRSDFRDTALWLPSVVTDAEGRATVGVPYPDSTTRWRTSVRAATRGTHVGQGSGTTRTRQPLIARLQAPRFFLEGDELTLSGNLNNNTDAELSVNAALEVEGLALLGRLVDGRLLEVAGEVTVPAGGQARVDWRVRVDDPGEVRLVLRATSTEVGDAVELRLPAYPHGIEALVATAGRFDADQVRFGIDLPAERGAQSTRFTVSVTPSLAVTMLDALPYLVDYPYGCTEQTLSRFLPTAIVAGTLSRLGLSAEDALSRAFGGIEAEFVDRTQPDGKQASTQAELDRMIEQGLERLYDFQHGDGGWGWWKTGDSDRFMTAYVLWGLSLARDAGVEVRAGVLEQAARWLSRELVSLETQPALQAWLLHAVAVYGGPTGDPKSAQWVGAAFDNLWQRRTALNSYGRALLTLSAQALGKTEEARVLVDNLIDGADRDDAPDASIVIGGQGSGREDLLRTAHWGNDGISYRWDDGSVEATAFALRALVAVDPQHELVEPVANWLVQNRRGAQWSNTRDTAICVLALNDYLEASGQLGRDVGFELQVNGQVLATQELSAAELLRAPSEFVVDPSLVRSGENVVLIRRTSGSGPLYFNAHATFFSREEPIPARGNQVFVRREYTKLVGRPTLLDGFVYERVPLRDGDAVQSGERIEVTLTIEAKNDLEYLVFEDLKPAGFEAVQVKSGQPMRVRELKRGELERRVSLVERREADRDPFDAGLYGPGYTGRARWVHQELRDRKVALFVDKLPDGLWEIRYDLRAEVPGSFHALPVVAHAMYVPEVRANGQELRLEVRE